MRIILFVLSCLLVVIVVNCWLMFCFVLLLRIVVLRLWCFIWFIFSFWLIFGIWVGLICLIKGCLVCCWIVRLYRICRVVFCWVCILRLVWFRVYWMLWMCCFRRWWCRCVCWVDLIGWCCVILFCLLVGWIKLYLIKVFYRKLWLY